MSVLSVPRVWSEQQKNEAIDLIIAEKYRPGFILQDWQRETVLHLLSGNDVLLQAPTGAGKSLPFQLYALARPGDTVVVVSPLKMLEQDMVKNLTDFDISAVALNADTEAAAAREHRDLWRECADGQYRVIFCSPEQLASPKMSNLLEQPSFQRRVRLVVVDEVHLIPIWGGKVNGRAFRRAFMAIGSLRSRLDSSRTVFHGLSATLMPGKPTSIVESSLGFRGPNYIQIKLDCVRTNLHIVLRRINSSYTSGVFDELDWLLAELLDPEVTEKRPNLIPKAIIYVDNIPRGWDLVQYLRNRLPPSLASDADSIIRHIHSATCADCKQEILDEFSRTGDTRLRIVVATEVFGCGINIPDVVRVVNYGTPRDFPAGYQRIGRAGRKIEKGWGYIYVNPMLWDEVVAELGVQDRSKAKRVRRPKLSSTEGPETIKCCPNFRQLIVAHLQRRCHTRAINHIYQTESEEGPQPCGHCSGCVEDDSPQPINMNVPKKTRQKHPVWLPKSSTRGAGQVRQKTTARARQKIAHITRCAYLSTPTDYSIFNGPDDFLPPPVVNLIAKYLRDLDTPELIHKMIGEDWEYWDSRGPGLSREILRVRGEILAEIEAVRLAEITKRREDNQEMEGSDQEVGEGMETDDDEGIPAREALEDTGAEPDDPRPRFIIRIPPRQLANLGDV